MALTRLVDLLYPCIPAEAVAVLKLSAECQLQAPAMQHRPCTGDPNATSQAFFGKLQSHDDQELCKHGHLMVGRTRRMWASHQLQFECPGWAAKRHPGCGMGRHRDRTHRSTAICWARDQPNRRALSVACREFFRPWTSRTLAGSGEGIEFSWEIVLGRGGYRAPSCREL